MWRKTVNETKYIHKFELQIKEPINERHSRQFSTQLAVAERKPKSRNNDQLPVGLIAQFDGALHRYRAGYAGSKPAVKPEFF